VAKQLAGRLAGISRTHFYEINEAFKKYGAEGWPLGRNEEASRLRAAVTRVPGILISGSIQQSGKTGA
jgi:hypothetical protein